MRGVTDALLSLVSLAERPDGDFLTALDALKARHVGLASELVGAEAHSAYVSQLEKDCADIAGILQTVRIIRVAPQTMRDVISGYGEIWSTRLFAPFLRARGRSPATCFGSTHATSSSSNGGLSGPRCSGRPASKTSPH